MVSDEDIRCWEINYGLDKRNPIEAARWWEENNRGQAPAGAVVALGLCLRELKERRRAERNSITGCERE